MRKKITLGVFGLLLLIPVLTLAGEGSDTVGDGNLLLQLRYSYTENEYDTNYDDLLSISHDSHFDFVNNAAYLQVDYGLTDYVDVYCLLGYSNAYLHIKAADEFRGDFHTPFWGVGVKGTFYRAKSGFYFGGGLSFTHAFTLDKTKVFEDEIPLEYFEYQEMNLTADLHVGWRLREIGLNPYFGVEYRYTWMYFEQIGSDNVGGGKYVIEEHDSGRFVRKANFGVYAGLDYYVNDHFFLNIEGHAINYWGGSVSVGYFFGTPFTKATPAGEGSDTIGSGDLLLQLKYAYYENDFISDWQEFARPSGDFEFNSHSTYLRLDYGISDHVDIHALIGYRQVDFKIAKSEHFKGDFDTLLWGAGIKSTFYRSERGFYFGGSIGVTHAFTPDKQRVTEYAPGFVDPWPEYVEYSELNLTADLHAGWHFTDLGLTPYAGVEFRYTWANFEEIHTNGNIDNEDACRLEQKNNFGIFVGLEYLIGDRFFLNVEGHMLNRWGGSFGFGYLFDL
jgi:outer membrane protein W